MIMQRLPISGMKEAKIFRRWKWSKFNCNQKAGYEEYTCKVSDGNVTHQTYFVLDIESGLEWTSYINGKQAERDEDGLLDASIEAETGDKVLMEVKAESSYEDSTLSYQWYKDDEK